ncbi:MAG: F0F1 ATP synthase subunit B [Bacteroidales bacterium]
MELVSPGLGLIFWTCLIFLILFLLLRKFAFPAIMKMLKEREEGIECALQQAEVAKKEMKDLQCRNEDLLNTARVEREKMLNDARQMQREIETESRTKAQVEYNRILAAAMVEIEREKQNALEELRGQISSIAVEMAEKVLRAELEDKQKQKLFIEKELQEIKYKP